MIIRPLDPSDWRAFRSLRLESLETDPHAFGATAASTRTKPDQFWIGRLEEVQAGRAWLVFAEEGERLVGMVGAMPQGKRAAEIISMFVRPESRGCGVGRLLLERILSDVAASGVHKATLNVRTTQTSAIRLYRSCGFVEVPSTSPDELTMQRDLVSSS